MLDKQNQAIVGKVVLLVIFLALLPTIISSIVTAQATSGIDTSASSMLDIFQMLVVVGGIGLTSMAVVTAIRGKSSF